MKTKAGTSKKQPLLKLIFSLIAIIQAGALLFAALGWQGVISFQTPLIFVFAALGAICLLCTIAFGYETVKPEQPDQTAMYRQPQPGPAREEMPEHPQEFRRPPQHPSGGTVLLFDEHTVIEQDNEKTIMTNSRKGLRLTWEVDGNPHQAVRFDYPVIIGRDLSCPLVINAPSVSRRHAQLEYVNNEFLISDMGSSNGTYLNGNRVDSATRISHGDEITLGSINIRVDYILQ